MRIARWFVIVGFAGVLALCSPGPTRLHAGIHELHPGSPAPSATPEDTTPAPDEEQGPSAPPRRHHKHRPSSDDESGGEGEAGGPPAPEAAARRGPYTLRAEQAISQGDGDRALDLAQKALHSGEDRAWAQLARSKALLIKGDKTGALAAVTEAIEIHPNIGELHMHRATIYKALGMLDEATRDIGLALSLGMTGAGEGEKSSRSSTARSAGPTLQGGAGEESSAAGSGAGVESGGSSQGGGGGEGSGGPDDAAAGLARIRQRLLAAQATIDQINAKAGRINNNLTSIHAQMGGDVSPSGDGGAATSGGTPAGQSPAGPGARFEAIQQDHQVTTGSGPGVRIRCPFTVQGMSGKQGRIVAYFEQPNGTPLQAPGGSRFRAADGRVAAAFEFTPAGDPAQFSAASLVVPYSALNPPPGVRRISFYVQALGPDGRVLATTSRQYFEVNP